MRTNLYKDPALSTTFGIAWGVSQALDSSTGVMAGPNSLRLTANQAYTDSYAQSDGSVWIYPGIEAGKTYTLSAYVTLTAPLTTGLHTRSRRLVVFTRQGSNSYGEYMSNQPPNVAGTYRVSVTFTTPATNFTEAFFRWYNGATSGGGSVWWDATLLEEGSTLGDYFDGNTVKSGHTYQWAGTPNNSISYEDFGVPTEPTVNFKRRESGLWVARTAKPKVWNNGAWVPEKPKRWNGSAWVDLP